MKMRIAAACGLLMSCIVCGEERDWTIEDSVAVRYFVDDLATYLPGSLGKPRPGENPIAVSPDSRHFMFVSFRGDLKNDTVIYELYVYAVADVRKALTAARRPQPIRQFALASGHSSDSYAGIFQPGWESATAILFHGAEGAGKRRLYRYDIASGQLSALTPEGYNANADAQSWAGDSGGSLVFAALDKEPWRPLNTYPVVAVKADELAQIQDDVRYYPALNVSFKGGPVRQAVRLAELPLYGPWVSPDGKWAVAVYPSRGYVMPEAWRGYRRESKKGFRFMLIDIERASVEPMLDAPGGAVTESGADRDKPFDAFWSPDSRRVILLNTALPLSEKREERRNMSYIIDYSIADKQWSVLEPMADAQGRKAGIGVWLEKGSEVLVPRGKTPGVPEEGTIYSWKNGAWSARPAGALLARASAPALPKGMTVGLRQSANDPQMMVARQGGRTVDLLGPDPALNGVWRARAEIVEWREPDGQTIKGLLMLPRNVAGGQRLPLVVQGFSYEPQSFRPDGVSFSAFAGQSFAAQGFAVLYVDFAYEDAQTTFMTPAEFPRRVLRIDAIVDALAGRGLIDPERVGLIGFSRSGLSTYYTITHPGRTRLGAVIVFDSITASYGDYVSSAGMGDMDSAIYDKQYGTGNFWQNKQGWLEGSPAFNVERIKTPAMFTITGGSSHNSMAWAVLETVGAFRYNRKPLEYLLFPEGYHNLQRPRERSAAMRASLDWMNFWLRGVDPGPEQGERAERWRKMRADWQAVQAEERSANLNMK